METRKTVRSTCLGCIGNCGAIYEVQDNKIVRIKGDRNHPLTKGFLCVKGQSVEEIRSRPDRLRYPLKRTGVKGEGKWTRISWDDAINEIAGKLSQIKESYGPEAIVMADGFSGVLTGLDPVVGKFMHLLGSPNRLVDLHN